MKTLDIIISVVAILFLFYITVFEFYIKRNPIWKSCIKELKFAIAERLIYFSLWIMPDGKEKVLLAKFIIDYVGQKWHMDEITPSKGFEKYETYLKAISNNIPIFSEAVKTNDNWKAADNHGREKEKECLNHLNELISCENCDCISFVSSKSTKEIKCAKCGQPHDVSKN